MIGNDDGKVLACSSVNFHNRPADKQALLLYLASVWQEQADMQNAWLIRHGHNKFSRQDLRESPHTMHG